MYTRLTHTVNLFKVDDLLRSQSELQSELNVTYDASVQASSAREERLEKELSKVKVELKGARSQVQSAEYEKDCLLKDFEKKSATLSIIEAEHSKLTFALDTRLADQPKLDDLLEQKQELKTLN